MMRMHRLCFITTVALTLGVGIISPAQAAAPSNDGAGQAKAATGIGFSDSVNVSQATSGALDPTNCANNASVWYKFTAATAETINVNTNGSNYDTVIGVYTGRPGSFTRQNCVNYGLTRQAALDLQTKAGTTYWFMVGVCCGTGRDGQSFQRQPLLLQFNMRTPLRIAELTAADAGVVDLADGEAHVTVSRRCDPAATSGYVIANLRQRVGTTFVARSGTFKRASCGSNSTDLTIGFQPRGDIAFGAGAATLSLRWNACSRTTGTCTRRSIAEEVVLAFPQP